MKILSTAVSDHIANGESAVSFSKRVGDMSHSFKQLLASMTTILADDGHGGKVIIWNGKSSMIMADAKLWLKRNDDTLIKFSMLLFKTPEQLVLDELGMSPVRNSDIDKRKMYQHLLETYQSLGIQNWVETGAPVGLRSILAHRYGYELTAEFNNMLSVVMKEADDWLIFNLQQVMIEDDLRTM